MDIKIYVDKHAETMLKRSKKAQLMMSLLTRRENAVKTLITGSTVIGFFYRTSRLLKSPETHVSFLPWPFAKEIKGKASILSGGILQHVNLAS